MAAPRPKGYQSGAAKQVVPVGMPSRQGGERGTVHQEKLPQRRMETNVSSTCLNSPAEGAAGCTWPRGRPTAPQPAEERREPAQCPTELPGAAACPGHSYCAPHRPASPSLLTGSATAFSKAGRGSRLSLRLVQKTWHFPRAVLTAHGPPPHLSAFQRAGANGPPTWLGQAGSSGEASVCGGADPVPANSPPAPVNRLPPFSLFPPAPSLLQK